MSNQIHKILTIIGFYDIFMLFGFAFYFVRNSVLSVLFFLYSMFYYLIKLHY